MTITLLFRGICEGVKIVNKKFVYLFITGRRVRERSIKAPNKYKAVCKIRALYPEVLNAGTDWLCIEQGDDYRAHRNMLLAWNGLAR